MSISRWKVMAGVLGVSLGGLAAIAGQCPRSDGTKTQRTDDAPLIAEAPKVPQAGAGTKPTPPPFMLELPAPTGSAPALPSNLAGDVPKLPAVPPPPAGATIPQVNLPRSEETKPPVIPTVSAPSSPTVVPASATIPVMPKVQEPTPRPIPDVKVPDSKPATPTAPTTVTPPAIPAPNTPTPANGGSVVPPIEFTKPVVQPTPAPTVPQPETTTGATARDLIAPPAPTVSNPADVRVTQPVSLSPVTAAATKFRIILRVGEGEPSFEVRSGDDLVMKVLCEKVDIKSPEKGQSLSSVTASGKVRFAGFGSEGTCENLSFLAGTGEVSMTGSVKIQVKDKLGRVESELTTDTIKYKLDASALPGQLKP